MGERGGKKEGGGTAAGGTGRQEKVRFPDALEWRLEEVMQERKDAQGKSVYRTATALLRDVRNRGVEISSSQFSRWVYGPYPAYLRTDVLWALLEILDCTAHDLVRLKGGATGPGERVRGEEGAAGGRPGGGSTGGVKGRPRASREGNSGRAEDADPLLGGRLFPFRTGRPRPGKG